MNRGRKGFQWSDRSSGGFSCLASPCFLPALAFAQEATLGGTVVDATGGVLPGATLTAVDEASGNTFEGVTDERGVYRISVRAGVYRLSVAMPGFANSNRQGIEVLVGQQVGLNFELSPSTVQESITITSDAPLIDLTSSSMGGNVDPRQTQELPPRMLQLGFRTTF